MSAIDRSAASLTKIDLMLVEDNENDAELTLRAIQRAYPSLAAVHVCDGEQALQTLRQAQEHHSPSSPALPRLVMLDLKLPGFSGVDVLKQIRAEAAWSTVPVVVYSSSREARDMSDAYRHGASSYVVKPVNFDAFMQTMGQVVQYWLQVNATPGQAVPMGRT